MIDDSATEPIDHASVSVASPDAEADHFRRDTHDEIVASASPSATEPTKRAAVPMIYASVPVASPDAEADHLTGDTHDVTVASASPSATGPPTSTGAEPTCDTSAPVATSDDEDGDQAASDTHPAAAAASSSTKPAQHHTTPTCDTSAPVATSDDEDGGPTLHDTHSALAAASSSAKPAQYHTTPTSAASAPSDAGDSPRLRDTHTPHASPASLPPPQLQMRHAGYHLMLAAATLDEIEGVRKASAGRIRSLDDPPAWSTEISEHIVSAERAAVRELERIMRDHPLGPFVDATKGLGRKGVGRLLAAIGDPYWNHAEDRARRGPSELWAYCGFHVVDGAAPRHRRGQQANWSTAARMRAYLLAEASCKVRVSTYRPVYDAGREKYAEAVHAGVCVRCGPEGKPAQPGSPLSLGHQHGRALRLCAKAILRDLWVASRAVHHGAPASIID